MGISGSWPAAALLSLATSLTMPAVGFAGEIADQAVRAETLLSRGYSAPALAAFDQSVAAFWSASPLQLRTVTFAETVKGYADYTPRPAQPFRPSETMTIYLEPFGFGFAPTSDGFRSAINADIQIRTPGGLILAEAENFVALEWLGRSQRREVQASIKLPLPALKPGEYLLDLTLRDQESPKSTSTTLPFSVAE